MSRWLPLALGLVVFLLAALFQAPVATLWHHLAPEPRPVSLRGLEGTLFKGQLQGLGIQQQTPVERLEWRLRPLALLGLQLHYQLEGRVLGGPLTGAARVGPTGRLRFDDTRAGGDLKALLTAVNQGFLPVNGQWRLDLDRVEVRNGWPQQLEGRLQVHRLTWTLLRDPLVIGDFEADLLTEPDGEGPPVLVARIRSVEGSLEVDGSARQYADRRQFVDLRLRAAAGAPPLVGNLLQGLGRPDAEGWYRLQQQGRLP